MVLEELKVGNPPASGYLAEDMLLAEHVEVDLDLLALVRSCGREIVANRLVFHHCWVLVEKHSVTTSNVAEVVRFWDEKACSKDPKETLSDRLMAAFAWMHFFKSFTAQEVSIKDFGAAIQVEGSFLGLGERKVWGKAKVVLPDIVYEDFTKVIEGSALADFAGALLRHVLQAVEAHVLHN